MKLWLSCFLLFASALLSSSAPTPEECQAMVAPVPVDTQPVQYGRLNLIAGYMDKEPFKTFLKMTESSWGRTSPSPTPTSPIEIVLFQANKINGTCIVSTTNVTLEGDTAKTLETNVTTVTHVLRSCEGCQVHSVNTAIKNFRNFLKLMKIDIDAPDEIHTKAIYLLGPGSTLKDSDLEHFKKQASCLGFSGEPDFHYNPENSFCQEGEGVTLLDIIKYKATEAN